MAARKKGTLKFLNGSERVQKSKIDSCCRLLETYSLSQQFAFLEQCTYSARVNCVSNFSTFALELLHNRHPRISKLVQEGTVE